VKSPILYAGVIAVVAISAPLTAQAQGVPGGFAYGVHEGYRVAGPLGAVVGGPVGGVIGGVQGVLGVGGPGYYGRPRVYHRHRHVKKRVAR